MSMEKNESCDLPVASDNQLALCTEFQGEVVSGLRELVRQTPELSETFCCGRPKNRADKSKPARLSFLARHVFTPGKTGHRNMTCGGNEIIVEARVPDLSRREDGVFSVSEEDLVYVRFLMGLGLVDTVIKDVSFAMHLQLYRDIGRTSIRNVLIGGRVKDIAATIARSAQMVMGCVDKINNELKK